MPNTQLMLLNKPIERVTDNGNETSFKYVGVQLDEHLTSKKHVDKVHQQIMSATHLISGTRLSLTKCTKIMLYKARIKPHLEYAIAIWGNTCKVYINKLAVSQKKAVRVINNRPFGAHTGDLFKQDKILKLNQLLQLNLAKLGHSLWHGYAPQELLTFVQTRYNKTRQKLDFYTPLTQNEKLRSTAPFNILQAWNNTANYLRKILSPLVVKNQLKINLMEERRLQEDAI